MKLNAKLRSLLQDLAKDFGAHPTLPVRAQRILDAEAAPPKPKAPKKKLDGATAHHAKARRAEERVEEAVKLEVWADVLHRVTVDHRGRTCCEACHMMRATRDLEPHHLVFVLRTDAVELVMALCDSCHRLDPQSAHRAPRAFAQKVVIPWAKAHDYPLPNRKEYRTP